MKKITALLVVILGLFLTGTVTAYAALPATVGTTLTALQTDGLALIDLVWPVVGAIVGGFILLKLFKRGASKI